MTARGDGILVVGIGNPDRGDDGAGPLVVRALAERIPDNVTLLARGGDMLTLIDDWTDYDTVICVDAAELIETPGVIHRLDLSTDDLPRALSFMSSHALGLSDAIALARALGVAPRHIVVYAIEGGCFDIGASMTASVAQAAGRVADRIVVEIQGRHANLAAEVSHA